MTRRKDRDEALFALPAGRRGRVERAVNAAVTRARRDGTLGSVDDGLIALARATARAVDLAEGARDLWALARVAGELRETLTRLRLDPTSRGANRDSLTDFLRSLAEPAAGDPPGPAPMGDEAHPD